MCRGECECSVVLNGPAAPHRINGSTLTITLGTSSGTTGTVLGSANATWTPDPGALDLAGNAAATPYTETDNDLDF